MSDHEHEFAVAEGDYDVLLFCRDYDCETIIHPEDAIPYFNALEGMNPEAVREVVEAAVHLIENNPLQTTDPPVIPDLRDWIDLLEKVKALARLEEK